MNRQVSRGVFKTVARCVLVCKVSSSVFVSHFRGMLMVVESMFAVCVETVKIRSSRFCARSIIWITASNKVRMSVVDTMIVHAGDVAISTYPVMFSQSAKQYVAFRLTSRSDMCEARSRVESEGRTGRRTRVNDLHSFRDTCRGRSILVPSSYRVADIGKLVRLSRDPALGLLYFVIHLGCCLCCACRLARSQAFAPAYSRCSSSVSSATLAVLGCRVASSPSDIENRCLWISTLQLRSIALPCATAVAAYSIAGRGLFRKARRRTTWVATQIVCRLAEPCTQEKRSVQSALFTVLKFSGSASEPT